MFDTPSTSNEFDKYDEPRLHMERLLKAHLVEFDISLRILCPLEKAGIRTLGDLVNQTAKGLRKINQLGRISVETLENSSPITVYHSPNKKGLPSRQPGASHIINLHHQRRSTTNY